MGGAGVLLPLRLAPVLGRAEHYVRESDVALVTQDDEPRGFDAFGSFPHPGPMLLTLWC